MSKKLRNIVLTLVSIAFLSSCETFEQVLKTDDYTLKAAKAKEYYNAGDYYKSQLLFEELISFYKGTENVEPFYYYYAYSFYGQREYISAAYYFKRFADIYPNSDLMEECRFMEAKSYYRLSPRKNLDQTYTLKAIESMQNFVNVFPTSDRVPQTNALIDELRIKLEQKAFESAGLYLDIKEYQAAASALENIIKFYPETKQRERIKFMILKSYYLLAENSVSFKQKERYSNAVDAYYDFVDKYPKSEYSREAERFYSASVNNIKKLDSNE